MQMYLSLAQNLIQHSTLFYTLHAILKSLQKVHNFDATNERAIPGGLVGIPVHSGVMLRAEMRMDKADHASLVFSGAGLFVRIGSEAIFPIVPAL